MVTNRQRYREKVSQMISWGHWFALFNILLGLLLGSRYLFVADWPSSLFGRVYAVISWLGHFSFVGFSDYIPTHVCGDVAATAALYFRRAGDHRVNAPTGRL